MLKIIISCVCWLLAVNCLIVRDNIHSTSSANVNETNSTTRILDFWKKHEKDFEIGTQKDVIIMLGNRGAGITTMSLVLTDADLESIDLKSFDSESSDSDYSLNHNSIIDKNGRIGHDMLSSETFLSGFLIDPESGAEIYDAPELGYSLDSGIENQVATAYFLNKLANSANSTKLVIIVSYESIIAVSHIYELLRNIEQLSNMIGDFEKFNGGIAMIANHADNDVWKNNGTTISFDDANLTKMVVRSLKRSKNKIKKMLVGVNRTRYSRHFLRQATKFIEMLLVKRNDNYERIGIFRKAPIQGPVNDIEVLRNEKIRLKEIIHKNIKYIPKGDTEYGYLLSYNTQTDIQYKFIEKIIKEELSVDVTNICNQIEYFYFLKEKEITDINLLETNLKTAYWKLSDITTDDARVFVKLIIDAANDFGINLANEIIDKVSKRIENIDFLTKVSASPSETSSELIEKLSDTITQIRDSQKWYEFLIYLERVFSRNDSHSAWTKVAAIKVQARCLIDEFEMRYVSDIFFDEKFSNYVDVRRYDYVKQLRVNSFELKALYSVLNVLFQ